MYIEWYANMLKFFAEKMWVCIAKAIHIFPAKNIRKLYIESAKTVNEMTLNELVKLTTLWTTGPRHFFIWMFAKGGMPDKDCFACEFITIVAYGMVEGFTV